MAIIQRASLLSHLSGFTLILCERKPELEDVFRAAEEVVLESAGDSQDVDADVLFADSSRNMSAKAVATSSPQLSWVGSLYLRYLLRFAIEADTDAVLALEMAEAAFPATQGHS